MKFLKRLSRLFWILLTVILLLSAYSPILASISITISSVLGLAFPYLLFLIFGFSIFSILMGFRWAWLPIICCILIFPKVNTVFAIGTSAFTQQQGVKIVNYNVLNFRVYYNQKERKQARSEMLSQLADQNADIYCFQEFYTQNSGDWDNIAYCKDRLNTPYYTFAKFHTSGNQSWGLAIFSKHPISEISEQKFDQSLLNGYQLATVNINGTDVDVLNVHFQSFSFREEDVESVEVEMLQKTEGKSALGPLAKLMGGYLEREKQLELIRPLLDTTRMIITGDFNSPPISTTYEAFSDFQDAHSTAGFGIGSTYNGRIPLLRIDYCFFSPDFEVTSCIVDRSMDISDHFPVIAKFKLLE